jgi:putative component of toxin-antitoxin plasmid stabilization module
VCLSRQGKVIVLLLCGSDKREQDRVIEKAIDYLKDWKRRG